MLKIVPHWSEIELRKLKRLGFNYAARFQCGGGSRNPKSEPVGFMHLNQLWEMPYVLETLEFYKSITGKSVKTLLGERYHAGPEQLIYNYVDCPQEKGLFVLGWFCDLKNNFNEEG